MQYCSYLADIFVAALDVSSKTKITRSSLLTNWNIFL